MPPIDAGRDLDRGQLSETEASALAKRLFGIDGRAQRLDGEYDENFRIGDHVLKVASPSERAELVDLQLKALVHLEQGNARVAQAETHGSRRWVRLLDYVPGVLLADVSPQSAHLLKIGRASCR